MKFENPIMNISMFEVEDVITMSGGEEPVVNQTAQQKAAAALKAADTQVVLSFN